MQAAPWVALWLILTVVAAEEEFVVPGIRAVRPKRQGIFFPGDPLLPDFSSSVPSQMTPALDLPEDMDLSKMDIHSLSILNSIGNISDFAHLFGIDIPVAEDDTDSFAVSSRIGDSNGASELAVMANCKSELVTVPLDLPNEPSTIFYPTCVRVERCGGCCLGPLLTCRPKLTKVVKMKVFKTVQTAEVSSPSRRPTGRRRRRRNTKSSFHEVEVIKHVQCECGCKVQEQDCNPSIHNYLESECSCVCKSRDEKAKCEQQNDKYWDSESCNCYCKRTARCGSGEFFSHITCKCEPAPRISGTPVETLEGPIERRRPFIPTRRRRPVRVPLSRDEERFFSRRPTFLNGFPSNSRF